MIDLLAFFFAATQATFSRGPWRGVPVSLMLAVKTPLCAHLSLLHLGQRRVGALCVEAPRHRPSNARAMAMSASVPFLFASFSTEARKILHLKTLKGNFGKFHFGPALSSWVHPFDFRIILSPRPAVPIAKSHESRFYLKG